MPPRFNLVIFDCDGVLIDSEGVASAVVAQELTELGWEMTVAQAMERFLGMSIVEMEPVIEVKLGHAVPPGWRQRLASLLIAALERESKPIPGAKAMLQRMNALGRDWRVASNSSGEEMAVKFARTGMAALTAGRSFSATDMISAGRRPKPAPDVYLAAAADAGVAPARCLVLEDSPLGVQGAVAAGMTCYGFDAHGDGARLTAAGAQGVLHELDEIFGVIL